MVSNDIGRYAIGATIPLVIRCTLAGVADTPASHPTVEIRNDTTAAVHYYRRVAADGQGEITGLFRQGILLGDGTGQLLLTPTVGRYTLTFRWTDSLARNRVEIQQMQVVGGGSQDGAIVALHAADGPDVRRLLIQTDAGILKVGKNPR